MEKELFSRCRLRSMMMPLFCEQLLVVLVGVADTLMVSFVSEAAVSGVALVDQFNIIFVYLFLALASGGAVVVSQYIGHRERASASEAASQLLLVSTLFSLGMAAAVLLYGDALLRLLFGSVEPVVMEACATYLRISAYSYPALGIYNAGAALCRSQGHTGVTMCISAAANAVNIAGDAVSVFVLNAGVAGVAWASFAARLTAAVIVTLLCFSRRSEIPFSLRFVFRWNRNMLRRILSIAVPNGVENGIFQIVKVALTSIAALFGTYQIAANGVAQSIWSLASLAGVSMGPLFITVIGQCVGAGNYDAADFYFRKLGRSTALFSTAWNFFILALTPFLLQLYALPPETKQLALWLVVIHNCFNGTIFPYAAAFANGLRAAGDVKFTMYVSVASSVGGRLVLSWLLGIVLDLGVIGLAAAMVMDWSIRAVLFIWRRRSGRWRNFQVI